MSASGRGFQVEYPSITLHAVSRAESGPCIYCQLDESNPGQSAEGEDSKMSELSLIPTNPGSCTFIHVLTVNPLLTIFSFVQWKPSSKLCRLVHHYTPMKKMQKVNSTTTLSSIQTQILRSLMEMKMRNLVRLGGCAAISSMITVIRRTRPDLFCSFFPNRQAALAHLESVIYNPFEDAEAQEASPDAPAKGGLNGTTNGTEQS